MPQAIVASGRKCPLMRSVTNPSIHAIAAVAARPTGSVSHGDQPNIVVRIAVAYAPKPTNVAWPNDVCPATPVSNSNPSATRL